MAHSACGEAIPGRARQGTALVELGSWCRSAVSWRGYSNSCGTQRADAPYSFERHEGRDGCAPTRAPSWLQVPAALSVRSRVTRHRACQASKGHFHSRLFLARAPLQAWTNAEKPDRILVAQDRNQSEKRRESEAENPCWGLARACDLGMPAK